jgi:AcrR family transcriptional regulator
MPRIAAPSLAEHHDLIWSRLLTAVESLLATKPYDEITLAEVAARAGIARNTIYNYAPDKAKLLAALGELAGRELVEHLCALARGAADPATRLSEVIACVIETFRTGEHRHVLLRGAFGNPVAIEGAARSPLFAPVFAEITSLVVEGAASGVFRPLPDPGSTVAIAAGALGAAVDRAIRAPETAEQVRREIETFLLRALGD